jgi:endoglucanase
MRYLLLVFILAGQTLFAQDFSKGVNLSGWFEHESINRVQFSKYTRQDFINIKSLGCNVIRLPIKIANMSSGAPDYIPDVLFLQFLDEVIDWAEELELYIIIDNHPNYETNTTPDIEFELKGVWENMAEHLKHRSKFVVYEIMNEPYGIDAAAWGALQGRVVDAIRAIDNQHKIIVTSDNWSDLWRLNLLPEYSDENLIYTFHFYAPQLFTGQGTYWGNPSQANCTYVPFPYNETEMPPMPAEYMGTHFELEYNAYPEIGTVEWLEQSLQLAADFKASRNVPVFCGEFGVWNKAVHSADRNRWHDVVVNFLEANDISYTLFNYDGGFGIFEPGSFGLFDSDIDEDFAEVFEFTVPEKTEYVKKADSTELIIYDDYFGQHIYEGSHLQTGTLNHYAAESPKDGTYCFSFENLEHYESIDLYFAPFKDLSKLEQENYHLGFWIKGNKPGTAFNIHFKDSKTSASDHPWRMGLRVDETLVQWDNTWHYVSVPLNQMTEIGTFDGSWHEPQGLFDWSDISNININAEYSSLEGARFWIDDLKIYNPASTGTEFSVKEDALLELYPNPTNGVLNVSYQFDNIDSDNNYQIKKYITQVE